MIYKSLLEVAGAIITGTHSGTFRSGEYAKIISVGTLTTAAFERRPCFLVRFPDGKEDYIAICDSHNYIIRDKEW